MKRLMKNSVIVILIIGTTFYFPSCNKEAAQPVDKTTPPVVITSLVSDITQTTASVKGSVTDDGGAVLTDIGVCWSTSPNPTISSNTISKGTGTGSFTSVITGLTENTTYYVRAFATNSAGTSYGKQISFTTEQTVKGISRPTLTTASVTLITQTSAISGGIITDTGGGDITDRGITFSTTPVWYIYDDNVSIIDNGSGSGSFVSYLSDLSPGTTYYVKAYAVNDAGMAFGPTLSFTTNVNKLSSIIFNPNLIYGTLTDIDGNIYKTIQIGDQVWMAENLRTTRYNDGTPIPDVEGNTEWSNLATGAYCWFNNSAPSYSDTYGALYNWYAVNEKLCPTGWHVPTDTEWSLLTKTYNVPEKVIETGNTHWLINFWGGTATNETGFTALPAGRRSPYPLKNGFEYLGSGSFWWSSTNFSTTIAVGALIDFYDGFDNNNGFAKTSGLSVRCVKN
jgi:uncharacterized protein (TIGR02145 family)